MRLFINPYVIYCLYISHSDEEFVKVGLAKGALRQYLVNRYIYGEIGLNVKIIKAFKVDDGKRLRSRSWRKFNRELEEYLLRVNGGECSNMIPMAVAKVKKFDIVSGIFSCCCGILYIVRKRLTTPLPRLKHVGYLLHLFENLPFADSRKKIKNLLPMYVDRSKIKTFDGKS